MFCSSLEHSPASAGTVVLCHKQKEKKIPHRLIIDLLTSCLTLKFFIFFYSFNRKNEVSLWCHFWCWCHSPELFIHIPIPFNNNHFTLSGGETLFKVSMNF